jgi:YD repeat-containing protein
MKKLIPFLAVLSLSVIPASAFTKSQILDFHPDAENITGDEDTFTFTLGTCFNTELLISCYRKCDESTNWKWATSCEATYIGSLIMTGGMRYQTSSFDYQSPNTPSGCSPCGGVQSSTSGSGLPSLEITRNFEPLSYGREHLTFGSVHGMSNYDQRLVFTPGHTAVVADDYGNIVAKRSLNFNPLLQCWTEGNAGADQGMASIHLFNAAGIPIITAATRDTAHTAVRMNYDGSSVHFEVLWDANGRGIARPVAFLDRRGNAIELEYIDAHPTYGTPAIENFRPYFRKSVMRDAHGLEAHFTYTKLWHKYVATRIDLPNGGHITYDYIWNGGAQLEKVTHADGAISLWDRKVNTVTKLDEYTFIDAKSDSGHRRKRVYFTQGQGFAPGGGVISTTRARVRRAQNGAGEFTWDSKFTNDLSERYVYEGGNSVRKHTFASGGKGLTKSEHVTNTAWKGNFHAGDASVWSNEAKIANRQNNTKHFPTSEKDSRNRDQSFTRDSLSNEIIGSQFADSTQKSRTRNQFTQPLVTIDRLGRITTRTYSTLGDLLTETSATGTSDETTNTYLYNTRGQVIEARDALYDANFPELHNTRYEYNAAGFLVKKIDSADVAGGTRPETVMAYDSAGRMSSYTDPNGRITSYEYDLENRLIKTTYNDTSTELVEYGT